MIDTWRNSLLQRYTDGIDLLERALRDCPDDLWGASVWQVRLTDRHVWPILRGVGAELPDEERLQLHSAFWVVAYHVLFFLDHYLTPPEGDFWRRRGGTGEPNPPPPFRQDEQEAHVLPHRVYTRNELLEYAAYCRRKAASVLGELTEEQAASPARIGRPFADLLLHNLVQLNGHVEQFHLFLNQRTGWQDSRWSTADRWFRPCPDCR